MLEERLEITMSISADDKVNVRKVRVIYDDGVKIAESLSHHHVYCPGADYSFEDSRVQAVCSAVHTPEAILAEEQAEAARQ